MALPGPKECVRVARVRVIAQSVLLGKCSRLSRSYLSVTFAKSSCNIFACQLRFSTVLAKRYADLSIYRRREEQRSCCYYVELHF